MKKKLSGIAKAVFTGFLACSVLFPFTGCQKSDSSSEKIYHIAVIVKSTSSPYWNSVWNACDDIEKELGGEIVISRLGPEKEDTELQIAQIKKAIAEKTDAIVLAACDMNAENEVLASATAAGIPIITIDTDVNYEKRLAYVGTMNKNAGETAARRAASLLDNEGTVGVIYHGKAVTASSRRDAFLDFLEEKTAPAQEFAAGAGSKPNPLSQEKETSASEEETQAPVSYSNIKISEALDGESDWTVSQQQAVRLITEDNVDLIFATNSKGTWGACTAISQLIEAGTIKQGEVHVIGFDYFDHDSQTAEMYLSKGILDTVILQNPYNMGYLGIRYALSAAKGEPIPSLVDTGAVLVTADNINDDDIQFLIEKTK